MKYIGVSSLFSQGMAVFLNIPSAIQKIIPQKLLIQITYDIMKKEINMHFI